MTRIDLQGDLPLSVNHAQISAMAERIFLNEAPSTDFEVSILCTDSVEMRKINRIYRGVDATTDVLSFEGERLELNHRDIRFCDIIIDTNQVFLQKGKNTYREEFWQVLIHALLHLAGYDHIRTSDRKKMEDAEENYRKQIPEGLN